MWSGSRNAPKLVWGVSKSPYTVVKDEEACSVSKPWAVKKKSDGKVMGCHETKKDAQDQQAAIYANEDNIAARAAIMEHNRLTMAAAVEETPSISLVTIQDVPILQVGMDWPSANGPISFSGQMLTSAVEAGQDPIIPRPRIKLGHDDPRYNESNTFDATPNFGFLDDIRLEKAGTMIYSSLVALPEWLAEILPIAYPSRSVEGWFNYEGPNNKTYEFLITALALLGVCFPGIMALEDLPLMYGAVQPKFVEVTI